jgi:FkbM family methyltransferase
MKIKYVYGVLKSIISHPLNQEKKISAIFRYFKWQINTILNPYEIIYSFTEKSKLIIGRGMTGATGNLISGLHEYYDMFFLLHFLRKQDLFIDVGANIGSYTILSSAHVGANTISFEPIPQTYMHLMNNIKCNDIQQNTLALNMAIGCEDGRVQFTSDLDTMNHFAISNESNTVEVNVQTLDNALKETASPILIKIDVEGFENDVIKGAQKVLSSEGLKAIIIELNGCGSKYGFDEAVIHDCLIDFGFLPYSYNPITRNLRLLDNHGEFNTIYIRDIEFVQNRLIAAEKVKIRNKEI